MRFDFDLGINIAQSVTRRLQFAAADVLCSVKNLPLEISDIDPVEIDKPEGSHTGRCKIERGRGTQTAGTNAQNARCLKPLLPFGSDFGHDQMPRIALQFAPC
jgi:hypothetical protein